MQRIVSLSLDGRGNYVPVLDTEIRGGPSPVIADLIRNPEGWGRPRVPGRHSPRKRESTGRLRGAARHSELDPQSRGEWGNRVVAGIVWLVMLN